MLNLVTAQPSSFPLQKAGRKTVAYFITKPKAESGNYQRERPMLHMLKLKSPENAR